jgi:hypothetical protein
MVPYHRPKSGHITCYLNRTYHVLLTRINFLLTAKTFCEIFRAPRDKQ